MRTRSGLPWRDRRLPALWLPEAHAPRLPNEAGVPGRWSGSYITQWCGCSTGQAQASSSTALPSVPEPRGSSGQQLKSAVRH